MTTYRSVKRAHQKCHMTPTRRNKVTVPVVAAGTHLATEIGKTRGRLDVFWEIFKA